jgi:hypothetical protein
MSNFCETIALIFKNYFVQAHYESQETLASNTDDQGEDSEKSEDEKRFLKKSLDEV